MEARLKVVVEGVSVPANHATRTQQEGSPTSCVVSLWPTHLGSQIRRGSQVQVFYWEEDDVVLAREDPEHFVEHQALGVTGVWKLFFDGYLTKKPTISRRGQSGLILYCAGWTRRLNQVHVRSAGLGAQDVKVDQDRAFLGINPEADTIFTDLDITGEGMGGLNGEIEQLISNKGVGASILDFFRSAARYDPLFARIHEVTNLSKRMAYLDNPIVQEFLQQQRILDIVTNSVKRLPKETSLAKVLGLALQYSLATNINLGSPYFADGTLYQQIYKPQLFFSVPPKSNIIFPATIDHMEPVQEQMAQPTRYALVGHNRIFGSQLANSYAGRLFYPEAIRDALQDFSSAEYTALAFEEKYTEEELIEDTITPQVSGMPFPDSLMQYGENDSGQGLADFYGRYAYHLARNNSDPIQIQTDFDPYLLCGLSAAILDNKFGFILGRVRSITDTIDVQNETMKTSFQLLNLRMPGGVDPNSGEMQILPDSELQIDGYDQLFGSSYESGAFFPTDLNNENISENFYEEFFGVPSIINTTDQYYNIIVGDLENQRIGKSLAGIYQLYREVTGETLADFVRHFKHRPIVNEGQYMAFIGAVPEKPLFKKIKADTPGERYQSSQHYKAQYTATDYLSTEAGEGVQPFMVDRQDPVLDYIEDIREWNLAKLA